MSTLIFRLKEVFKSHRWAIFLSVVAAIIVSAPTFLSVSALGPEYKGMPFLYQDNENFYLARIQEIVDGHFRVGSPIVYEYKNAPTPLTPIGEYMYALPTLFFGLPLAAMVVFSKFLFPLLLFLLVYSLTYLLIQDGKGVRPKLFALMAASVSILGFDLAYYREVLDIFSSGSSSLYLSIWTRLVNPITGGLFLFIFFLSIWAVIRRKKYFWLVGGVTLGLMTGYVFSFGIAIATAVLLLFIYAIKRRLAIVKGFIGVLLTGGLLNVINLKNFLLTLSSTEGNASALKNGLLLTHTPLLNKLLLLAFALWLGLFLYNFIKKRYSLSDVRDSDIFVASLLVASFIAMNQQLITGKTVWPQHFIQYTIPISVIALSVSLSFISRELLLKVGKLIAITLIIISFVFGLRTLGSYAAVLDDFSYQQNYKPVFDWLNSHTAKDCVVFVKEKKEILAPLVPALTHCNSYYTSYSFVGVPYGRLEHNYLSLLKLNNINPQELGSYLDQNPIDINANFFRDWKEMFSHSKDPWLISISDREAIDEWKKTLVIKLSSDYKQFFQNDFYTELAKYRLDYVMWDENADPTPDVRELNFLKEVYSFNNIHLYEVKR
ncbi:hypothetical protein EPN83_00580 [Patescibacteria group bacterium]|nr:MAG: hypothetical protein EPN83_00580 [Patescibacteria group bacterium]